MSCLNSSQPLVRSRACRVAAEIVCSEVATQLLLRFWLELEINTMNTQNCKCNTEALNRPHAVFIKQQCWNIQYVPVALLGYSVEICGHLMQDLAGDIFRVIESHLSWLILISLGTRTNAEQIKSPSG